MKAPFYSGGLGRWIACCLLAAVLNGGVLQAADTAEPAAVKPNIVLFLADDLTWHDAGCYGNGEVRTPHIDRLASQGMRFTACFTGTAMCTPTRSQLYTGVHAVRNGAYPNHSPVRDGARSFVHHFRGLGYRVGLMGKRHVRPQQSFPFEFLGGRNGDNGRGVDLDISLARRFIEDTPDRPWFLVVASNQPHKPWNRGDASVYDPAKLTLPPYLADTPKTRQELADYYAEVTYLDDQVGQILKILDETETADDTIVLFTSEQGSNFPFCKWTCYDAGVKTMLIVRWPGRVQPGSRSEALVHYVDIVPTLIEAAGGDPQSIDTGLPGGPQGGRGFDGRSFLGVLQGEERRHRDYVFASHTTRGIIAGSDSYPIRSVRDERYKLILNLQADAVFTNVVTQREDFWKSWQQAAETDPAAAELVRRYQHRPAVELYDLQNDPYEMQNLAQAAEHGPILERLQTQLQDWMRRQGDEGVATERQARQRR